MANKRVRSERLLSRRAVLSLSAGVAATWSVAGTQVWAQAAAISNDAPPDQQIARALASLDKDELVKLAMELANIPSPHGHEENLARYYHDYMRAAGLRTRLQPFASGRSNAIGTHKGRGGGRTLMFNGHLESPVPDPLAAYPTARVIDGEWIHGVGLWNMKASLAAYVAAVLAVRRSGVELSGDVIVAGVAGTWDESPVETRMKGEPHQGYGIGTKHMLAHGVSADFAVVGEPTSFKLVRQHFGTSLARIDVAVSAPEREWPEDLTGYVWPLPDSNAIECAAEIVRALRLWIPDYQRRNTVAGVAPAAVVSGIEGGLPWGPNSPRTATIFLTLGTPPLARDEAVLEEIERVLAEVHKNFPAYEAQAELHAVNPGPLVPENSPLVTAMQSAHADVFGRNPEPAVVQWYSDASALTRHGIPSVNYGPRGKGLGEIESVRITDIVACTRVYIDLIVRICARRV